MLDNICVRITFPKLLCECWILTGSQTFYNDKCVDTKMSKVNIRWCRNYLCIFFYAAGWNWSEQILFAQYTVSRTVHFTHSRIHAPCQLTFSPGESELVVCLFDFPAPFIPKPWILLGQAQAVHTFRDTITLILPRATLLSYSINFHCHTVRCPTYTVYKGPHSGSRELSG